MFKRSRNEQLLQEITQLVASAPSEKREASLFKAPITNVMPEKSIDPQGIVDILKNEHKEETEQLRFLVKEGNEGDPKSYKQKNFSFFTPSGVFTSRNRMRLIQYSGYIMLDYDDMDEEEVDELIPSLREDPYVFIAFKSPSGRGVKIMSKIKPVEGEIEKIEFYHHVSYYLLNKYFKDNYQLLPDVDESCKNIARGCLLPYCKEHELIFNQNSQIFEWSEDDYWLDAVPKESSFEKPDISECNNEDVRKVKACLEEIEEKKIDITFIYHLWVKLGFSCCSLGEELGRSVFHAISQYYPDYDYEETDKQFNYCYQNFNPATIGIGTLLYEFKRNGIYFNNEDPTKDYNEDHYDDFPLHVFPQSIQEYITSPQLENLHNDFLGCGVLSVASLLLGNKCKVNAPKVGYQAPILWFCLVEKKGAGKSPAISKFMKPIYEWQQQRLNEYYQAKANGEDNPRLEKMVIEDSTMEKTLRLLYHNQDGLLQVKDEFIGLLNDFNRYRQTGGDLDKYLSLATGETLMVDRVNDEPIQINNPFLNIFGGTQPSTLSNISQYESRGFLDRILFSYPKFKPLSDDLSGYWSEEVEIPNEINQLLNYRIQQEGSEVLKFSKEGFDEYQDWYSYIIKEINRINSNVISQEEWKADLFRKYDYIIPRIALVIQMLYWASGEGNKDEVCKKAVKSAIELGLYFLKQRKKVNAHIETSNESSKNSPENRIVEKARRNGGYISTKQVQEAKIKGLSNADAIQEKFNDMADKGIGKVVESNNSTGGKPTIKFVLTNSDN